VYRPKVDLTTMLPPLNVQSLEASRSLLAEIAPRFETLLPTLRLTCADKADGSKSEMTVKIVRSFMVFCVFIVQIQKALHQQEN
jgi:hypothetical protein